jgi:hypothetical protein
VIQKSGSAFTRIGTLSTCFIVVNIVRHNLYITNAMPQLELLMRNARLFISIKKLHEGIALRTKKVM